MNLLACREPSTVEPIGYRLALFGGELGEALEIEKTEEFESLRLVYVWRRLIEIEQCANRFTGLGFR